MVCRSPPLSHTYGTSREGETVLRNVIKHLRVLRALQNRSFALLWLGQTCSSLGDGAFTIALAWEVLLLTGSATAIGLVVMAEMLPRLLFLLLGGVAADLLPRQRIFLFSGAGRGSCVLLF